MKKTLCAAIVAGAMVPMFANAEDKGTGCGWGSMVWKGQSGLVAHILAGTTNGILGNQTFGLTTGTGGCDAQSTVQNEYQKKTFVAANMDNLAQDAAKGSGAHLSSLAAIIGVEESDRDAFYSFTQENYDALFGAENTDQETIVSALDGAMAANARFAKYVR